MASCQWYVGKRDNLKLKSDFIASGRLLQPDQPALWVNHRVLLSCQLPRNEGDRRVGLLWTLLIRLG